ncbi:MAG: histidine phosphatase family protein [Geitlerinemataceae cyanobacterium]
MSLNIYFLRHGETASSQTGTYCGRLDIDLTVQGVQMAERGPLLYALGDRAHLREELRLRPGT